MRSLYLRILITIIVALGLGTVTMFYVSASLSHSMTRDLFTGIERLQLQQARHAYESGGRESLRSYLAEVDGAVKGTRALLDANGRDLVSGEDRSDLAAVSMTPDDPPVRYHDRFVVVRHTSDRKYTLVVVAPLPPIPISTFYPYFVIAIVLVVALGVWLALGIVRPLHELSVAMNRFGAGELEARAKAGRKDEIGDAACDFNNMADRISSLMVAERRLLQDVSHELRSPLARLSFAAELMKSSSDPDAAQARMKREISRLSQLVGTLLEMTSAEGDPDSHRLQPVPFDVLVREVVSDCQFEATAREVLVTAQVASPATVMGDLELLRRALENVLRNAIRYSPKGSSVQLDLTLSERTATARVRDFGPGVPEDALQRIFDPFYRVEASRDASSGGVGLGLSIVKRVVQLHSGQVHAMNASPGLCVEIILPLP
ncbi:MAG: ATP-binding protein [Acidobacteriota bacterium]|nr:ATP-binding protein [Acidobacteriota bacterium]